MTNGANLRSNAKKANDTENNSNSNNSIPAFLSKSFLYRTIHDAGHDLKSPLFVIRGYSQLLQRVDDKDAINRGIKLMEEASYKMEYTVNGLVELMDIYTAPNTEKENNKLASTIEKVSANLSNTFENIGTVLSHNIDDNVNVFFDKSFLKTILSCVVDNAIRHNQDQENLKVYISYNQLTDGSAVLEIEDNGKGIDMNTEQQKLRKPFYKFSESAEAVGIGLAKVEAVAQVTNNKFTIDSGIGKGTICSFYFKNQVGPAKEIKGESRQAQ